MALLFAQIYNTSGFSFGQNFAFQIIKIKIILKKVKE
jgi:hypothetical protein